MVSRLVLSAAIILTTIIHQFVQLAPIEEIYFWRDYTGDIPPDAVSAGKDSFNQNVYIGQVYVFGKGLVVVQITSGDRTVTIPRFGAEEESKHIKILCGTSQEAFRWLPTTNKNLHVDLKDKHALIGGHEDGLGDYYIGRVNYGGDIKVGEVDAFSVGNSPMYFISEGNLKLTSEYEVLYLEEPSARLDSTPTAGSRQSVVASGIIIFATLVHILFIHT